MKWNKLGIFFIFLSLVLALTSCSSISNLAIRYRCLSSSGLVIDGYTGKPIVGAAVQVLGSISRPTGIMDSSEIRNIYYVAVKTDKDGIYTIPASTNEIGIDWEYYEQVLISKPGDKSRDVDPLSFNESIPSHGLVIRTIKLRHELIAREELFEQETNITNISKEEIPSNSIVFYTAHNEKVEDSRFIEARGLSKGAYIRPKPEFVITRIKSFSSTETSAFGDRDYKTIAIKLFPADARKLEVLRRTRAYADRSINEFVVMLGNKPTSSLWLQNTESIPSIPIGYLVFPKDQNTYEIEKFLQQLVQSK